MKRRSGASAVLGLSAALMGASACGDAFSNGETTAEGEGDAAVGRVDASIDPNEGGSVPPPGDGSTYPDGAPIVETCTTPGATRACAAPKQVQTCLPRDSGNAWSKCTPTDCAGVSPLPSGSTTSCVAAGTFTMGGLAADTLPAHTVALTRRYFLDQFEVTVGELNAWWNSGTPARPTIGKLIYVSGAGEMMRWTASLDAAIAAPGSGLNCTGGANKPMASINCVTYATALAYCMSLSGRLPTEAEWEYAASGQGKNNSYPWGSPASLSTTDERGCLLTIDSACVAGPFGNQFPFPRPSATDGNTPTDLGKFNNMAGNMAEWTLDFAPALGASCTSGTCWPNGGTNPLATKDNGQGNVVRGGSFASTADQVQTRARAYASATAPALPSALGFRCAYSD